MSNASNADVRLRYTGPASSVTFAGGRRVRLAPGTDITIPSGSYAQSLLERGYARHVESPAPSLTLPAPAAVPLETKRDGGGKVKS